MTANNPALARFREHLPVKPYCTDNLATGLRILPLCDALKKSYIQPNGPGMVWVLVFDVDRQIVDANDWWPVWESANLPTPNFTAQTVSTGRGHLFYLLAAGVTITEAGHLKPLRYLAGIQRAYTVALDADQGYAGLVCKNPFHKRWRVWEIHGNPYALDDLACHVDLSLANRHRVTKDTEAFGLGRNVSLFDMGRKWAYKAIRSHWAPNGLPKWERAVREQLEGINAEFSTPLPQSEVKATAKSIAKWTWARITPTGLQDLIDRTHTPEQQRKRGRKASNQVAAGAASGVVRKLSREQDRATARLMRTQGMTQRAIAEQFGVSRQAVSKWLRN